MALKGKEKPKQLLTPATADVGVGEMTAELPTWLLYGLRRAVGVCRSTWARETCAGRSSRHQTWPRAWRGWQMAGRSGCNVMKDLNTEGQVLSQGNCGFAEDPLTAISIWWPKLVLATVFIQLIPGTQSVMGVFCVLSSLRSRTTLQMLQN